MNNWLDSVEFDAEYDAGRLWVSARIEEVLSVSGGLDMEPVVKLLLGKLKHRCLGVFQEPLYEAYFCLREHHPELAAKLLSVVDFYLDEKVPEGVTKRALIEIEAAKEEGKVDHG